MTGLHPWMALCAASINGRVLPLPSSHRQFSAPASLGLSQSAERRTFARVTVSRSRSPEEERSNESSAAAGLPHRSQSISFEMFQSKTTEVCRISATRALTCNSLLWAMLTVMSFEVGTSYNAQSVPFMEGKILQRFCKPLYDYGLDTTVPA